MNKYTKAIVMAAVPIIAALGLWGQAGDVDLPEFSLLVLGLLSAVAVALTRNAPEGVRRFAKFLVAAAASLVTAVLTALFTGDWSSAEWTTLLVGLLTALLVWLVENSDDLDRLWSAGPPFDRDPNLRA